MKKIRILRVIARLNIGGPAIHTILLTAALSRDRFETILACGCLGPGEGDMSYYAEQRRVSFTTIPFLKRELNVWNDVRACIRIYSMLARGRFDIIHTHTAKAGTLGRIAAVAYNLVPGHPRVKLVHTFHGHVLSGYFSKTQSAAFTMIERLLALKTDRIITVSDSVRDDLVRLGIAPRDRIQVIKLGFELDRFLKVPDRPRAGFFSVGIVGRLVGIKNHRMFIDAAAFVPRSSSGIKTRFKVIGDGEERTALEAYARSLALQQVEFTGWQKDLAEVYAGLDAVVLTSFNEGTPVSLIEAMACAKPVIATDVGGVRDLMGTQVQEMKIPGSRFRVCERGILVDTGDSAGLAAAITFVLSDERLRGSLGRAARQYVSGVFSQDRLVKDMENLYKNIVKP